MVVKTIEPTLRVPPKEKMTFEEFLDWCDEDTYAEWVDGEVVVYSAPNKEGGLVVSPASIEHQELGSFLEKTMGIFVEARALGRILRAPFAMRLPEIARVREPDLLFVRRERLGQIHRTFLDGVADLVVEIVSPESFSRDRGEKFVEYESAGVKEYWLIDPDRQVAEFHELASDGRYRLAPIGAEGIYRSKVVAGFWLRVDWLWQMPLPPALDVLRELKIV